MWASAFAQMYKYAFKCFIKGSLSSLGQIIHFWSLKFIIHLFIHLFEFLIYNVSYIRVRINVQFYDHVCVALSLALLLVVKGGQTHP